MPTLKTTVTVCNADVVLQHDNMLLSQLRCINIFNLMRQQHKRSKLECAALFCAAVSTTFKTQRGTCTSVTEEARTASSASPEGSVSRILVFPC